MVCNGSEGWEEAVHIPTGLTYVTEEHFFSSKRLCHTWHWVSSEGWLARKEGRDGTGPGEAEGWCFKVGLK